MNSSAPYRLRLGLMLFVSFALGMHIAALLHEFGHALGSWMTGNTVDAIRMFAPVPAGEVLPRVGNRAYAWGGVVFGTLTALVLWALAWALSRWPAGSYVARLAAALGLLHNGVYLFVGGLVPYGDAIYMHLMGAPRAMLVLLGLPLLVLQVWILAPAIRQVGLKANASFSQWLAVVFAGFLSVPALAMVARFASGGQSANLWPMVGLFLTFAACFAVATWLAWRSARASGDAVPAELPQTWRFTGALFTVTAMFIFAEWLAFRPR